MKKRLQAQINNILLINKSEYKMTVTQLLEASRLFVRTRVNRSVPTCLEKKNKNRSSSENTGNDWKSRTRIQTPCFHMTHIVVRC